RTDGRVDPGSRDVLADALRVFNALPLTDVGRGQPGLPGMVADRHPLPAAAADDQALQEGGSFPGRTLPPVSAVGLGALPQPWLAALMWLPGDVAPMRAGQQGLPLFRWQAAATVMAILALAGAGTAVEEGAGITGVVQDLQGPRLDQRSPDQLASAGAPAQ